MSRSTTRRGFSTPFRWANRSAGTWPTATRRDCSGSSAGERKMVMKSRWWIVVASVFGLLAGNGPVMQFTIGTLLPPITREFGWTRGMVSSVMVTGLWMTAIATPLVGWLVDRFGIRTVALPAVVLFSCATASVALAPASPAMFTLLYVLMGLGASAQTPLVYAKAI